VNWLAGDLHDAVAAMRQSVATGVTELSQRRLLGASIAAVAAAELGDAEQVTYWNQLLTATKHGDWWTQSDQVTWAAGIRQWSRGDTAAATVHLDNAVRRMVETGAEANARFALFDLAELALEASDAGTAAAVDAWLDDLSAPDGEPFGALDTATRAAAALCTGTAVDLHALDDATAALLRCGWKLHPRAGARHRGAGPSRERQPGCARTLDRCRGGIRRVRCGPPTRGVPAIARSPGPAGRRARTATEGPGALTSRELEVVRLAVEGLATREIGERLFIGRRTVETHLTNAYAKLGIRSTGRAGADRRSVRGTGGQIGGRGRDGVRSPDTYPYG